METLDAAIGTSAESILWWQMMIRGAIAFLFALSLVRIVGTRVLGRDTSFDIVFGVMLGSMLSRSITGNARFFPTLGATIALVLLHRAITILTQRSRRAGYLIKGSEVQLVRNGEIQWDKMRRTGVTIHDLEEVLRLERGIGEFARIKNAFLERNGSISVIVSQSNT
jgi:uncharacterized membrane protein YcaP (DUF421 family)